MGTIRVTTRKLLILNFFLKLYFPIFGKCTKSISVSKLYLFRKFSVYYHFFSYMEEIHVTSRYKQIWNKRLYKSITDSVLKRLVCTSSGTLNTIEINETIESLVTCLHKCIEPTVIICLLSEISCQYFNDFRAYSSSCIDFI